MKDNQEKTKEDKLNEARALIMEENQKKLEACVKEITPILEKYGFGLQQTMPQIILIKK